MFAIDETKTSSPQLVPSSQNEFNEVLVKGLGKCLKCRDRIESDPDSESTERYVEKCMENFTSGLWRFFEENFGPVSHLDVVKKDRNRLSKGYGFVTFKHSSDALNALNASEKQLTVGREFARNLCEKPMKRALRIYQARESLRSRVRNFIQARKKSGSEQMGKCQDFTSRLIFEGVTEGQRKREHNFVRINNLPSEIFRIVFDNLKNPADWASCRLVCKKWNTIIQDIERFKLSISLRGPRKRNTDLNEYVFATLKKYPKLKYLRCSPSSTPIIDELTIEIIGQCCPKIEDLSLSGYIMSLKNFADFFSELKVLDLSQCRNIRDKDLCEFLKKAHNLKHLDLLNQKNITGKCFDHLSPGLEVMGIELKKIFGESITQLAKNSGSSLKDLRIGSISRNTLPIVWRSFPNLHTIEIDLEDSCAVGDFGALPKLENLQNLSIFRHNYFNDMDFINFIGSHKELKNLDLEGSDYLTDIGVSKIPDFCKNLEYLDISYSKISDRSLDSLSRLKPLKSLSIVRSKVTNDGLRRFLAVSSNLDFLDVNECKKVTPEIFSAAFELNEKGSLNRRLLICFRSECVEINALKDLEEVHELILKLQSKSATYSNTSSSSEEEDG